MNRLPKARGMTLLETVIAIGVIAVAVPLLLAATTASLTDRRNAEADTRSAWIAKDIQKQISSVWSTPRLDSDLPDTLTLTYPEFGTAASPLVFLYDLQAAYTGEGSQSDLQGGSRQNDAQYLVSVYSTAQRPLNLENPATSAAPPELARLYIEVQYPAKAALNKRQVNRYSVVLPKQKAF